MKRGPSLAPDLRHDGCSQHLVDRWVELAPEFESDDQEREEGRNRPRSTRRPHPLGRVVHALAPLSTRPWMRRMFYDSHPPQ